MELFKEMVFINIGLIIVAAAVVFFMMPSHLTIGSISGLSIVLGNFIPLPVSIIVLMFNIVLLTVAYGVYDEK